MLGIKLPTSISQKIGPFPLWGWLLGAGILVYARQNQGMIQNKLHVRIPHGGIGAIGGAYIEDVGGTIVGGGIGGYGDYGYFCSDDGYCGGGGGGDQGGGGPGGGGGGGHKGGKHGGGGGGGHHGGGGGGMGPGGY